MTSTADLPRVLAEMREIFAGEVTEALHDRGAETWLTVVGTGPVATFDDLAMAAGIEPLGAHWRFLDRDAAADRLARLLHVGLAYRTTSVPKDRAAELADLFVDSVGTDAQFATNGTLGDGGTSGSWRGATTWTFDTGLMAMGSDGAALLWIGEED